MTSLPDGYLENYEEIAKDIPWVSTETEEITALVRYSMNLLGVRPERLLDVGCGIGYMLKWAAPHHYGIDISHLNCRRTRQCAEAKTVQTDAQSLPFKSESFDMAICTDIYEHVPRPAHMVGEIERVLRPGGLLFFACPFEQDLSYYESEKYKRFRKRYRFVHLRSVDRAMLADEFGGWDRLAEYWVQKHMEFQDEPYPILFQVYAKKGRL
jgi:ubiquinone/menaquinone biosynthesis C-methylase UbiE